MLLSDHSIDIFAISETWWTAEIFNDEVNIDGYSLYRKDREHPAGGVALYVKSSTPHEFSSELTEISNIEAAWVKIMVNNVSPFNVCSFYRKPSADKKYFDNIIENFELAMSKHEIIILGDLNLDYTLDDSLSNNPAHYIELILNCRQLITTPTCCTLTTKSTIYLIYSSMSDHHISSGTVPCSISDHDLIYTVLSRRHNNKKPVKYVTTRDYK